MISVIFEQAAILDGTGTAPFTTDVGIVDDRIALIGDLADREATERVPCFGRVLAPGFIDTRSQSDGQWLTKAQLANKLLQGCTTVISGHGGRSAALQRGDHAANFDEFLAAVASARPGVNVATLAGIDDARSVAVLRDAWDAGAFGLSARACDAQRAVELATQTGATVLSLDLEAPVVFDDAIASVYAAAPHVAVRAGTFRTRRPGSGASLYRALEHIATLRDRGDDVVLDAFPYTASRYALRDLVAGVTFPLPAVDEASLRAATALIALALDGRIERCILAGTRDDGDAPWYGYTFAQYAAAHHVTAPRAIFDLLQANAGDVDAFVPDVDEDDLVTAFSAAFVLPASDERGYALAPHDHRLIHPRAFGTFPRYLRRFSQQRGALAFPDAIAAMTSQPAAAYGILERGTLAPGFYADLVLFDRQHFVDRATYAQPYTFADGVERVYVNGRPAVAGGALTGERHGRVLRRGVR